MASKTLSTLPRVVFADASEAFSAILPRLVSPKLQSFAPVSVAAEPMRSPLALPGTH